jgi:AAA+ ATPase superfamily predicted ATPase
MTETPWGFYGRRRELEQITQILKRNRWFFAKISGRRRIGKTSLVQEALRSLHKEKIVYIQIPDSDPAGVVSRIQDFLAMFGLESRAPSDLKSFAALIGTLAKEGYIIVIDEFQYFHRAALYEFTSHLQYEVDRLSADAANIEGGLLVLGSLHTELTAILEDKSAPLFNRITDQFDLPHLDIASLKEMLAIHADDDPMRLLFLWNLFEGVPKFYRDCYEQGVLCADRAELLQKMFFISSSPLRMEADNWFLREMRGRYDLVLKYIARKPGCTHADIAAHAKSMDPTSERQVSGYIKNLSDKYNMIERLQPVFAAPTARNGRFYLRDNFLRSWLAALAVSTASINFRPLQELIEEADTRLAEAEGPGFEKLVAALYEERSRKSKGDFKLTQHIRGYWDRQGTEIDLVALNNDEKIVRLGSCKRDAHRLVADLPRFDGHIARFKEIKKDRQDWRFEKVAIAPILDPGLRKVIKDAGYIPQDLPDLVREL